MSEKHLYEKHLADKLEQLSPPPDKEGNWQKMKALLDDDSPRGGSFGRRWWQIGVIAGILLIGGWLAGTQYLSTSVKNPVVATQPNPANVEEKKLSPDNSQPGRNNSTAANGQGKTPDAGNSHSLPEPAKNEPSTARATDKPGQPASNSAEIDQLLKTGDDGLVAGAASKTKPGTKNPGKKNNVIVSPDIGGDTKNATTLNNNDRKNRNNKQNTANNSTRDDINLHSDKQENTGNTNQPNTTFKKPVDYSPVEENTGYANAAPAPADKLKTDFSLLSSSTKEVLKSKSARAGKNRSERSFSFGFSLPLAFPLGDQKALSYNFNAGANTVSDYIPSPHVQYRLNKKTYLQTELQFISPQYIRPILLYETRMTTAGNYMVYNSVYARKLYYFNLPVGIHHSPFPNFYLGTGLQFSTLLSGVGLYEETKRTMSGDPVSLISERYGKLSGDSLTNRMNTGEVRLMLEANYYFNRFTFGLRYNQAFNNYADFRVDPTTPYTFDKNKALQFYLRYNLWENVRRRPNGKGLMSSK
jgi:hypothetical protein